MLDYKKHDLLSLIDNHLIKNLKFDLNHFSYYLETVEGPTNYLGKKTYFAEVHIPRGVTVLDYSAEGGELTIPVPGTYNMDIYLGLKAKVQDLEYRTK